MQAPNGVWSLELEVVQVQDCSSTVFAVRSWCSKYFDDDVWHTAGRGAAGQAIFTDDVSLQVFMEHLKRLVSRLLPSPDVGGYVIESVLLILCVCRLSARRRIDVWMRSFR